MQGKKEQKNKFKVLLIGSSGVGKSSLLMKFIKNTFSYDYQVTTGVEYHTKMVKINEKTNIDLQIWDTVGQETFRAIVRSFYKGVSAIILLYSIQRQESFQQLADWMRQIRENSHKEVVIYLVGCKLDLEDIRKVPRKKAEQYAKSIDAIGAIEVSSKTGQNVKQLFEKLARALMKKYSSCQEFRQLAEPNNSEQSPMKAQSFSLDYRAGKKNPARDTGCC